MDLAEPVTRTGTLLVFVMTVVVKEYDVCTVGTLVTVLHVETECVNLVNGFTVLSVTSETMVVEHGTVWVTSFVTGEDVTMVLVDVYGLYVLTVLTVWIVLMTCELLQVVFFVDTGLTVVLDEGYP